MTLPAFTSTTTAKEVATVFTKHVQGKNVLITGTSIGGLGFEAARVIADYCNLLVLTGYNSERLKLSEDAIKKDIPSANVRLLFLDLASLASVRKAAAEVNEYPEPLHVLIHNAAAPLGPFKLSPDGIELQMATDHIGPLLLTKLIAPKLFAAATPEFTPRVVFVSSMAHTGGTLIDFRKLGYPDPEAFTPIMGYRWAKQANVLAAIELSRRSQGKINAYSLEPGAVFTNIQQREESKAFFQRAGIVSAEGVPNPNSFDWKTIPQGAASIVAAAFDTRLENKPGAFLSDAMEANSKIGAHCTEENAAKLWTATEEIVGERLSFE
ncbi:hypothetical protein B0H11DRAFT_1843321 [Mycena galericulata]|nr:hypothetical protein B0H11DRAFT_1843321 [Mycena galericulata]